MDRQFAGNKIQKNTPENIMSRIFIGGLPEDASRSELEREFEYFGRLRDVWVARNPPGFGFIIFEDHRDAEDAVKEMDGKRVCGTRIRVEFARGPTRGGGRGGGRGRSDKCYNCGRFGHSTRECRSGRSSFGGNNRRRSRSKSRSVERDRKRRRSRSRSRSRSKERSERRSSRSRSRERHDSKDRYSRTPDKDIKRSRSRSRSNPRDVGSRDGSAERHADAHVDNDYQAEQRHESDN